jgi:nitrate reductase molybdenum cofactor assembly chaperone NarJ/NarW
MMDCQGHEKKSSKQMKHNNDILLKLISVLLMYPNEELLDWLTSSENELNSKINGSHQNGILDFVDTIKKMPLLHLQEHYTGIFDINPKTCLNLTYHTIGDSEDRGRALAKLDQVYRQAGYERTTQELPDYLPLILEFIAQCPEAEGIDLLWSQLDAVKNIAENFGNTESPYRFLFEILANLTEQE